MPYTITNPTLLSAVKAICRMVGHPAPAVDAIGSTDPAVLQMIEALRVANEELLVMKEWQDVTIKATLAIVGDSPGQKEKAFALPDDFYRFVDQSQWNENSQIPAMGPISNQAWMQYTVRNWTPQMTLFWQIREDRLQIMAPPFPTPVDFEYMYITRGTIADADTPTDYKNVFTKNGDMFRIDGELVTLFGRAKYLEWKGFESSAAMRDFYTQFEGKGGANKGAPILSLSRPRGMPLLDAYRNTPDTGFGS